MTTIRRLEGEPAEMADVQRVLEGAPDYSVRVTGYPAGPSDAQSLYSMLPEGVDYDHKYVFAILADSMIGCADVIRGWPDPGTTHVGLFLLSEDAQGRGHGRAAWKLLETTIATWPEIERIRLAVVRTNDVVLPFWHAVGFVETGEVRPYRYDKVESESIILAKSLP